MKVLVNTTNTLRIANNVGAVVALFFFKILPTMNWCEWCPPLITVYCCFTSKWCSRSGRVVCPVAVVSYRQPSTATQKPTILEYSVCIIRISAVPGMLYDTVYIYNTPWYSKFACSYFTRIFSFLLSHFYFPVSGQAVVSGVVPFPRCVPSVLIAHRVQHSHCSSTFID